MMYSALIALSMLTACTQKETKTVNEASQKATVVTATEFKINEGSSTIEWRGNAPDHFHTGAFKVNGSFQTNEEGKITGGDFTIPIASITNFDVTNPDVQKQLLDHLKSPDFFNMAVHPNATFHVTKAEPYAEESSTANTMITGDFKMIGQTHSIQIPTIIKTENGKMSAKGSFKLDRLKWGMNSFNDPKSKLYILPEVEITLKLNLDASGS